MAEPATDGSHKHIRSFSRRRTTETTYGAATCFSTPHNFTIFQESSAHCNNSLFLHPSSCTEMDHSFFLFLSVSSHSSYTSIYTILPYTVCTTSLQVPKGCCKVGLKKCNAKLWCAQLLSKIYSSFLLFRRNRMTQCDDLGVTYWSYSCDRLKSAHLWFILKHIFVPVFLSRK